MRDFVLKHKDELKLVYNLHSFGNLFILPFNGDIPSQASEKIPEQFKFFQNLIKTTSLLNRFKVGPSTEVI